MAGCEGVWQAGRERGRVCPNAHSTEQEANRGNRWPQSPHTRDQPGAVVCVSVPVVLRAALPSVVHIYKASQPSVHTHTRTCTCTCTCTCSTCSTCTRTVPVHDYILRAHQDKAREHSNT